MELTNITVVLSNQFNSINQSIKETKRQYARAIHANATAVASSFRYRDVLRGTNGNSAVDARVRRTSLRHVALACSIALLVCRRLVAHAIVVAVIQALELSAAWTTGGEHALALTREAVADSAIRALKAVELPC